MGQNIVTRERQITKKLKKLEAECNMLRDELSTIQQSDEFIKEKKRCDDNHEVSEYARQIRHGLFGDTWIHIDDNAAIAIHNAGVTSIEQLVLILDCKKPALEGLDRRQLGRLIKDLKHHVQYEKARQYGIETIQGKHPIIENMVIYFPVALTPHRDRGYTQINQGRDYGFVSMVATDFIELALSYPYEKVRIQREQILEIWPGKYCQDELIPFASCKLTELISLCGLNRTPNGQGTDSANGGQPQKAG